MPPSNLNYYNQTGPFWDFVADFEREAGNHQDNADRTGEPEYPAFFPPHHGPGRPFEHHGFGFPFGPLPFGRRPPPPPHHDNPPHPDHPHPPPPGFEGHPHHPHEGEHPPPPPGPEDKDHPMPPPEEPEAGEPSSGPHHRGRHGPGPHRRRGSRSPHGGPHGGPHGWGRGAGHCRRGRGFGGRGGHGCHGEPRPPFFGGGMGGGPFPFAGLFGPLFQAYGNEQNENARGDGNNDENAENDFTPEADVFDTETAFVIHVSLPGAKKEDVGVNWDAEKSELSIAGVIYRPGDEDFLKTLALGDRKVGPFEKKVRLGSRANPAQVDADMITAKLEDGILRVQVPKLDKDYVEVKKVDIE